MKKKKIWSSISRFAMAFLVIASWAVLGVALALKSAKVEIRGGITFPASGVYAKISGTVTGTKTTNTLSDMTIDADTQESFTTPDSWSDLTLDFKNTTTPIVIKINVQNLSSERKFWLVFTDTITTTNTSVTRKVGTETVTGFSALEVDVNTTKTLEISLSITNKNKSVSDTFGLDIELTDESSLNEAQTYTQLSFRCDSSLGTASVYATDISTTDEIVIPSKILNDGKMYIVTGIYGGMDEPPFNVKSVTIPSSVTYIESGVFINCTALETVTFEEGSHISFLKDHIFYGCINLTSINLPSELESIGTGAFYDTSLTSIIIPASVTNIGTSVFPYSLETLYFEAPENWMYAFGNSDDYSLVDTNLADPQVAASFVTFFSEYRMAKM